MISYVKGDATFPQGEGMKLIVHVCNNVGAWGAGFVMAISKRWLEPMRQYRAAYPVLGMGAIQLVAVESDITVVNLIGQNGTSPVGGLPPIRYDAIRTGLSKVHDVAISMKATVHMPRIGCGLAGGKWEMVEPIIQETLRDISVTVYDLP